MSRVPRGEVITCTCTTCGHTHKISERQISIDGSMVEALYRVYHWCLTHEVHEFKRKDIRHLLTNTVYCRFGDLVLFGGLVYKDGAIFGLNIPRCDKFFRNEYKIPTSVWKNPITKEVRQGEDVLLKDVPSLHRLLDEDDDYIVQYRAPVQSVLL